MKNNYALITGASSGIGLESARYIASKGINLILTARRKDLLSNISREISEEYNVHVDFFPCDLSDSDAPMQIYDYCKSKKYKVNILLIMQVMGSQPLLIKHLWRKKKNS